MELSSIAYLAIVMKVITGLAAYPPLLASWHSMSLTKTQRDLATQPVIAGLFAFGVAYAACSDVKAAVISTVILFTFLHLYDDLMQ